MARLSFTFASTAWVVREAAVRFFLATAVSGAAGAEVTRRLTTDLHSGRGLIVVGVTIGALLLPLVLVAIWAFFTAPRRHLQIRVGALETTVEGLQQQLNQLFEDKYGDPLQFLPIYQTLRNDIRQATRTIERAKDTGKLWSRTEAPEYGEWDKSKKSVATNPWARIDGIHGELEDAFGHLRRLSVNTAMRFGAGRRVRDSDDLDAALDALNVADALTSGAIDRLETISAPEKPWEQLADQLVFEDDDPDGGED